MVNDIRAAGFFIMLVVAQVAPMPLHASTTQVEEPNQEYSCVGLDEYLAPQFVVEIDGAKKGLKPLRLQKTAFQRKI